MRLLGAVVLITIALSGCARGESSNPFIPTATVEPATPEETSTQIQARAPCQDGVMLVSDLPRIDPVWEVELEASDRQATTWHDDAQLVHLRVSCDLFEPGFRMQPTYFSAQAQAMLAADTGESIPVNLDPDDVESLSLDAISFERIYRALIDADFTDDLRLDPSTGVDIRINSEQSRFGPPSAPLGAVIAHVSVEQSGVIKDVFVDEQTGEIYMYSVPA